MLPITGFQGTSLIDFPGKIASIIFLAGCDLRCPYCHNSSLFEVNEDRVLRQDDIFSNLEKRKRFIDGLVITGGEPTLYPELLPFIQRVKEEFGLLVKLDTNGLNPLFLQEAEAYVDYFAIDLKTIPELYPTHLGSALSGSEVSERFLKTKEILEQSDSGVEFRTTMYPPIVKNYEMLYKMYKMVPKNADYYLQRFISDNSWAEEALSVTPYSAQQLERMAMELRKDLGVEKIYVRTYS